jgi:hypothetical protein
MLVRKVWLSAQSQASQSIPKISLLSVKIQERLLALLIFRPVTRIAEKKTVTWAQFL